MKEKREKKLLFSSYSRLGLHGGPGTSFTLFSCCCSKFLPCGPPFATASAPLTHNACGLHFAQFVCVSVCVCSYFVLFEYEIFMRKRLLVCVCV